MNNGTDIFHLPPLWVLFFFLRNFNSMSYSFIITIEKGRYFYWCEMFEFYTC